MAKAIKKLDLKRETVRNLKVRAGIRTGPLVAVGALDLATIFAQSPPTVRENGCALVGNVHVSDQHTISGEAVTKTGGPPGSYPAPPGG